MAQPKRQEYQKKADRKPRCTECGGDFSPPFVRESCPQAVRLQVCCGCWEQLCGRIAIRDFYAENGYRSLKARIA